MKNIVFMGDPGFDEGQMEKVRSLGNVKFYDGSDSADDWLKKVDGADVIYSNGDYLLENLPKLKNVFVTYPFIELGKFDSKKLKENGVLVANTRGSSRDSIVEWVLFSTLALFRKFTDYVRSTELLTIERSDSLVGNAALIIGKGNIGSRVGEVYSFLGMEVDYFMKGDNLAQKVNGAKLVVNCLNTNSTSEMLLDEKFFMGMDKGSYFISFVRNTTFDADGLIKAVSGGNIAGAAIDCDPEGLFDTTNDFYKKLLGNEKILVTPHVAFATKQAAINAKNVIIENIESYLSGSPQNIVNKE